MKTHTSCFYTTQIMVRCQKSPYIERLTEIEKGLKELHLIFAIFEVVY